MATTSKRELTLDLRVERFPYHQPFRISGHIFTETALLVAQLSDGRHVGRGEGAGVYYLGDDIDHMVAEASRVRDAIERGAEFQTDGPHDSLIQILHGEPDPTRHVEYVTIVHSVCAIGGFQKGVELGIQIAQTSTELGGQQTSFGMHTTGPYGGVAWITTAPSLAELQEAEAKVNGDPAFIQLVDGGAPGAYTGDAWATHQRMYRKIH